MVTASVLPQQLFMIEVSSILRIT